MCVSGPWSSAATYTGDRNFTYTVDLTYSLFTSHVYGILISENRKHVTAIRRCPLNTITWSYRGSR